MDWNLAIERNREALKRVLAALVAMAEVAGGAAFTSPLWGGRREASGGGCGAAIAPTRQSDDRRPPLKGEVEPAFTLPRHLHRAILRLIRPTESAMRRLIIVMARGLVVPLARPRKARPRPTILRNGVGTGILMPSGSMPGARNAPRTFALPLLDPIRPFRPRPKRSTANCVPRISLPGIAAPFALAPRRPPAPDDLLDATRLALRLQALDAALGDLPRQARRFARWRQR
ncbi:hypothetical protein, partial [Mesorhizobium marinum]